MVAVAREFKKRANTKNHPGISPTPRYLASSTVSVPGKTILFSSNLSSLPPHHCSQDLLGNLRSRLVFILTDVNKKPTQHGKAGLLPPEESLCVDPSALLHAAPDHNGGPDDGVDNVDSVTDGVVELAQGQQTCSALSSQVYPRMRLEKSCQICPGG